MGSGISSDRGGRFGVTSKGDVMARYVLYGPVFQWRRNQMVPMPLQAGDLLWWLQASDEDDDLD